ncbi:hypothetical protein BU26DRAFT_55327 [Trematosphaeria pertusa]|uniref:Uncharacterized protein n=1 Tax=Trematosphaeria pertusa TaxID=390896 RepID=A0A6A6IA17_9PLEO|nr:uncharacterized protein BU26DRAFT_55327 [Trematosphaeria pertusa]KAF2246898.1 hypothetical protein BU26DRAFT_55327 [Trematosphaeria pertusa]
MAVCEVLLPASSPRRAPDGKVFGRRETLRWGVASPLTNQSHQYTRTHTQYSPFYFHIQPSPPFRHLVIVIVNTARVSTDLTATPYAQSQAPSKFQAHAQRFEHRFHNGNLEYPGRFRFTATLRERAPADHSFPRYAKWEACCDGEGCFACCELEAGCLN